jgi:hypothetical protein
MNTDSHFGVLGYGVVLWPSPLSESGGVSFTAD